MWVHPTVTASIMIAQVCCGHKVRCHMGVVEINWSEYKAPTRSVADANDIGKRTRPSHWPAGEESPHEVADRR